MNLRMILLVASAGVLATWGSATALSARAAQQPAVDASKHAPTKPFGGTHVARLPEGVEVEVHLSLLPPVMLIDGSVVRPMATRATYQLQGVHWLGGNSVHRLCTASSDEIIDLSVRALDLALHDPDPNAESQLRSFAVRMMPAPGKTWGTVNDMDEDVVFVAEPAN